MNNPVKLNFEMEFRYTVVARASRPCVSLEITDTGTRSTRAGRPCHFPR